MASETRIDPELQYRILALMTYDIRFLRLVHSAIKLEYFPSVVVKAFVSEIKDYFEQYGSVPGDFLWHQVKKFLQRTSQTKQDTSLYEEVWHIIKRQPLDQSKYLVDEVSRFIKRVTVQQAMLHCLDYYKQDEFEKISEEMEKAVRAGSLEAEIGHVYFDELENRTVAEPTLHDDHVRTFIKELDKIITGLRPKELLVFLAATGVGKSFLLRQLGKAAIYQGCSVCDITLEMPWDDVAERYDVSISGHSFKELQKDPSLRMTVLQRVTRAVKSPKLVIREYPTRQCSINDIKSHFEQMARMRILPDFLIVDYAGIMAPTRRYPNRPDELASIFEELHGFAMEYNIPVVTAAQANRRSLSKEVVTIADFAESFKSCGISNIIISICQTQEEKAKNKMRLFMAKNRRGRDGLLVYLKQDLDRGKFKEDPEAEAKARKAKVVEGKAEEEDGQDVGS